MNELFKGFEFILFLTLEKIINIRAHYEDNFENMVKENFVDSLYI